jgi:hypothetical protein
MREQIVESPSLFDGLPEEGAAESAARSPERVARDFVRWLFSFGKDFRNSPDLTNLRFWLRRQNFDVGNEEEQEIAAVARVLFSKKLSETLRKADPPPSVA